MRNAYHTRTLVFKILFICAAGIALLFFLFLIFFLYKRYHSGGYGRYADLITPHTLFRVERIVDGDTIIVEAAGHGVTLRLIGMDTPEVVDPRKQPQCFGPEASEKAKEILSGLKIEVEKDPLKGDYDKYGRVLGYVHVEPGESSDFPDGLFYNQFMIENGYAREYTYFKEPYAYQAAFKDAEITAKKEKRGLWGMCAKNVREKSG